MKVIEKVLGHILLIRFGEGRETTVTCYAPFLSLSSGVPGSGLFGEGAAMRAEEDKPDFRIGINLAMRRALKDEGLPKSEVKRIMRAFYKKRPDWHPGRPSITEKEAAPTTYSGPHPHVVCTAAKCLCPCPTCTAARIARNWRG